MASQVAVTELPMALDAGSFHWTNNQIFVPISVKLASSALQFAKAGGKHEAKFDFLYELRDVTTKRVAGSQRDTMTVPLDVSQQAIVYQGGILVGPGHYTLKFLARDNESGRMGTVVQDLVLYPAQDKSLATQQRAAFQPDCQHSQEDRCEKAILRRRRQRKGFAAGRQRPAHRAERHTRVHFRPDALRFLPGLRSVEDRSSTRFAPVWYFSATASDSMIRRWSKPLKWTRRRTPLRSASRCR